MGKKIKISDFLSMKKLEKIEKICMDGSDVEYNYTRIENIMSDDFEVKDLGTNRIIFISTDKKYSKYIFKIAGDEHGIDANYREFRNGDLSKWLTQSYSISENGVVLVQERVKPFTSDMMDDMKKDVREMLKKLSKKLLLVDCRLSNFKNFGLRKNGEVCLLDHGDTIPLPEYQNFDNSVNTSEEVNISLRCKKILSKKAGKKGGKPCNGKLKYDKNFEYLVCEKCGNYAQVTTAYTNMCGDDSDKEVCDFDMKEFKKKLRSLEEKYAKDSMKNAEGERNEEEMKNKKLTINGFIIPKNIANHPLYKSYIDSFEKGNININKLSKLCNYKFKKAEDNDDQIKLFEQATKIMDKCVSAQDRSNEPKEDIVNKSVVEKSNKSEKGSIVVDKDLYINKLDINNIPKEGRDIRNKLKPYSEFLYSLCEKHAVHEFNFGDMLTMREGVFIAKQLKLRSGISQAYYVADTGLLKVFRNEDPISIETKDHIDQELFDVLKDGDGDEIKLSKGDLNDEPDEIVKKHALENEERCVVCGSILKGKEIGTQFCTRCATGEDCDDKEDAETEEISAESLKAGSQNLTDFEKYILENTASIKINKDYVKYNCPISKKDDYDKLFEIIGIESTSNVKDLYNALNVLYGGVTITCDRETDSDDGSCSYATIDIIHMYPGQDGEYIDIEYRRYYNPALMSSIHVMCLNYIVNKYENDDKEKVLYKSISKFMNYMSDNVVYDVPDNIDPIYSLEDFSKYIISQSLDIKYAEDYSEIITNGLTNLNNTDPYDVSDFSVYLYSSLMKYSIEKITSNIDEFISNFSDDENYGINIENSSVEKTIKDSLSIYNIILSNNDILMSLDKSDVNEDDVSNGVYDRLLGFYGSTYSDETFNSMSDTDSSKDENTESYEEYDDNVRLNKDKAKIEFDDLLETFYGPDIKYMDSGMYVGKAGGYYEAHINFNEEYMTFINNVRSNWVEKEAGTVYVQIRDFGTVEVSFDFEDDEETIRKINIFIKYNHDTDDNSSEENIDNNDLEPICINISDDNDLHKPIQISMPDGSKINTSVFRIINKLY